MKKAKVVPQSMIASMERLREHMQTEDPLSRLQWMELTLPVVHAADARFATHDGRFAFMGRVHYHKLRRLIVQLVAQCDPAERSCSSPRIAPLRSPSLYADPSAQLLVLGPAGTGKSHLLAAAASDFTEEFSRTWSPGLTRKRVVAVLDCGLLQPDRALLVLQDALFVAFADDTVSLQELSNCASLEHLASFCDATESQLLWIFDQWQCLESHSAEIAALKTAISHMCCRHCLVRVASSSCELVEKTFFAGQPPAKLFMWDEGLEDQELECWEKWKFVSSIPDGETSKELLDEMELQILLDVTGRLPVYLSAWYDALKQTIQQTSKGEKISFESALKVLQTQPVVEQMREDLGSRFESAKEAGELNKLVDGVCKYLFGSPISKSTRDIDTKYFRIVNGIGEPSSGLVGAELARLLQCYEQTDRFFDAACLNAIKREYSSPKRRHPVIGGALVERAIIGALADRPLAIPLGNMTRFRPTLIELVNGTEQATVEDLHMDFLKGGKDEALFMAVPLSTTYKAVDAVLLGFRRESKGCHMYIGGLQITIGKLPKHRHNRKVFMKKTYMKWVPSGLNVEEDITWSMNWVVPELELPSNDAGSGYAKEKDRYEVCSRSFLGKSKMGKEVDCHEIFTTFRQIDSRLSFLDAFNFPIGSDFKTSHRAHKLATRTLSKVSTSNLCTEVKRTARCSSLTESIMMDPHGNWRLERQLEIREKNL
uniref:Uncharacterized protein n=2 Tax=Physcomitrium patens TaxID=3218 RepID=A0A2K1KIL9_PHYPA|nr:uncharacterized protein LOC112282183 isoform X1 [Physcomitrium patens]XP_024375300.1 uncharacterized protein LOC112282183 isoform X1 [Physcomitrium patens]PNR53619.1 hypothetical protein PHYPA_007294 [Physcomitrium patens]|eukprot:XP_024375299.1 uncharacterized protein LOC112282183 isoform X1 [Physcomitrella patens]